MDISVIVPMFNSRRYIRRCVDGLLNQTYSSSRYEVLIVDNNSTDGSGDMAAVVDRIQVLREAEQGSYAARNRGLRHARGALVAFTDPDCVPQPDWLEKMSKAMSDPQISVVLGNRLFASDSGMLGMLAAYESAVIGYSFARQLVGSYYAYTNNMTVRMRVLKALGGFEHVRRGGDNVFLRKVIRQYGASCVRFAPDAVVRHLEIETVSDYLEKKKIYGQVNRRPELGAEAVPLVARLRLAARAAREQRGSMMDALGFSAILAAGAVRFEWERRRSTKTPAFGKP